jgi:rare lipoprotein A
MYAMTAAHKTLPLPTYVRVTHRGNGRSIVVRVNDRGPFVGDRIIDLSYAAAVRLGMHNDGTALVDVEAIGPGSAPPLARADGPQAPVPGRPVWLQVGAFSDEANAGRLQARLADEGIRDVVTLSEQRAGRRLPCPDRAAERGRGRRTHAGARARSRHPGRPPRDGLSRPTTC